MEGQTAVALPVPEAEPLVDKWRARLDPSAAAGMPAHITVLFPFLKRGQVGVSELEELRRLFATMPPLAVEFGELASFPDVLYLAPVPVAPLVELTNRVERGWPDHPPFEGAFDDVVPHLTIANGAGEEAEARAREEISRGLPLRTTLREAKLFAFSDGRWSAVETFPLGVG